MTGAVEEASEVVVMSALADVSEELAEVSALLEASDVLIDASHELASRDAPLVDSEVTEGDTVEVGAPTELRVVVTLGSAGVAADSAGVSWGAVCATVAVLPTTVCVVTKPAVLV